MSTPLRHYLVIEEINRGNCAQIFGDIFQLLDRKANGFSEYVIDVDQDMTTYLSKELGADYQKLLKDEYPKANITDYSKIALPPNLYIWATMNTSDQSLFPMDSAFKRRWEWEYAPIDYVKANDIDILIGDKKYKWGDFLKNVNDRIFELNKSEDKQLGNWFVCPKDGSSISMEQFRAKVLFYLWFEIFKDEADTKVTIFSTDERDDISYSELFSPEKSEEKDAELINAMLLHNKLVAES